MNMYRIFATYKGHSSSKDIRIEKVAGANHFEGAGFAFENGERDLTFTFRNKKLALKAAARIRNSVHGVRAYVSREPS